MFGKTIVSTAFALGLALQVSAHAAVNPPLGVASGTAVRSDVQRPNNNCGNVNVAQTIDSSKAVTAAADGTFTVTAVDFNAGADGSRSFAASVDATGAGTKFVTAQVTANGNANPTAVGSDQLTVQLPAGTTCTGGATKNKCLVSFKSTAGFGNCVVVQQGAAAAAAAPAAGAAAATTAAAAAATTAAATTGAGTAAAAGAAGAAAGAAGAAAAGKKGKGRKGKGAKAAAAAAGAAAPAAQAAVAGAKGAKVAAAVKGAKAKGARTVVARRRLVDLE